MQVVPDHADEQPSCTGAVVGMDFAPGAGVRQNLGEARRRPAWPLLIEGAHQVGEAVGLGDHGPVGADEGRGHVAVHQAYSEDGQRLPEIETVDLSDLQRGQDVVGALTDHGREQPLLVAELAVDGALGAARPRDDRVDAGGGVALLEEQFRRGPEQSRPAVAVRSPQARVAHPHPHSMSAPLLTGNERYHTGQR